MIMLSSEDSILTCVFKDAKMLSTENNILTWVIKNAKCYLLKTAIQLVFFKDDDDAIF